MVFLVFQHFEKEAEAKAAVAALDGYMHNGNNIRVEVNSLHIIFDSHITACFFSSLFCAISESMKKVSVNFSSSPPLPPNVKSVV